MNSATDADLLKNHLRPAIRSKQHGLLNTGVMLQHDNARPHTARSAVATIQDLSFECFPHLCLGLPSGLFPSGIPTKTLYMPLLSPICVKVGTHL